MTAEDTLLRVLRCFADIAQDRWDLRRELDYIERERDALLLLLESAGVTP